MSKEAAGSMGISAAELERLLSLSDVANEEKVEIALVATGKDQLRLPVELTEESSESAGSADSSAGLSLAAVPEEAEEGTDLPPQISKLRLPEKIKLAMFGNATARAFLIRDANRMVQQFVLKNPRLQLREVEEFARNANLSEQIMRHIAGEAAWTKSYLVKMHLVFNPKTPSDVALRWVQYLNHSDLRKLAKSRNVPQILVTVARKRLEELTQR